jgi:hypothetical protein
VSIVVQGSALAMKATARSWLKRNHQRIERIGWSTLMKK